MTAVLLALVLSQAPLEQAQQQLDQARFEDVAATLAPLLADHSVSAATRARALVLVGLASHNLNDVTAARNAFRQALELDGAASLPAGCSPRTIAVFNEVKASVTPKVIEKTVVVPPVKVVAAPAPSFTPRRIASFVTGGLTVALAATGGILTAVGLGGRDAASAEPLALTSSQRFTSANTSFQVGTTLLFAAVGTLALSVLLFVLGAS